MMKNAFTTSALHLPLLALLALPACDSPDDGSTEEGPVAMAELGLEGQSFTDVVPEEFQSVIRLTEPGDMEPELDEELELAAADNPVEKILPTAIIEATPSQAMFPMQRAPREFGTHAEMVEFVAATFGATELIYDEKSGELEGVRGSYLQRGRSFFDDAELGAMFEVTDPVLAFVGGSTGRVMVGGEALCFDPDGDCDGERASYLEPVGDLTAPTHVNHCTNGVCVQHHSFYNRTWFPAPWARHGSNVRFTTYSALPSTRFWAAGAIHVPPNTIGSPFWSTFSMPSISNQGQNSIETAVWCFGTTACVEYQATAVCGSTTVSDQDVNGTRRTGNGPANNARCPG